MLEEVNAKKIEELEAKINKLTMESLEYKQKLEGHDKVLVQTATILKAMDTALGPVYLYFKKEMEKKDEESVGDMYG